MKVIAHKVWHEPAVFIGLLVTLGLLAGAILVRSRRLAVEHIIAILAPLATALGIRTQVKPAREDPGRRDGGSA